ncbi:hypothetical protein MHYP_G00311550 [Metynnis hypsauchen]
MNGECEHKLSVSSALLRQQMTWSNAVLEGAVAGTALCSPACSCGLPAELQLPNSTAAPVTIDGVPYHLDSSPYFDYTLVAVVAERSSSIGRRRKDAGMRIYCSRTAAERWTQSNILLKHTSGWTCGEEERNER